MNQSTIPEPQSILNKLGEIKFRSHKSKKIVSAYLPGESEIINILRNRNNLSTNIFTNLKAREIALSPFLEIGAERCQRASLLTSKFNSQGFALDLSLHSLLSANHYSKKLGLKKMPILVCADAYHLPFQTSSIPFVFCFETLHHFPHPKPIIGECLRVSSSNFYFSEEPVRQLLNLRLWRRDYHLNPIEKVLKKLYLLPFLSDIGKSEVDNQILENSFWLDVWKESLPKNSKVELEPIFIGPKSHSIYPNILTKLLLAIQGGGITALINKHNNHLPINDHRMTKNDLLSLLACPTCHTPTNLNKLICPKCKQKFKKIKNVYIMLPEMLRKKLYSV